MRAKMSRDGLRKAFTKEDKARVNQIKVKNAYDVVDDPRGIKANQRSSIYHRPNRVKQACLLVALVNLLGVRLLKNKR